MNVGKRSHVKKPYYVEVIEVGSWYIVTNIPNYYSVKIYYGNNWDYHIGRFEEIGRYSELKIYYIIKQGL